MSLAFQVDFKVLLKKKKKLTKKLNWNNKIDANFWLADHIN